MGLFPGPSFTAIVGVGTGGCILLIRALGFVGTPHGPGRVWWWPVNTSPRRLSISMRFGNRVP